MTPEERALALKRRFSEIMGAKGYDFDHVDVTREEFLAEATEAFRAAIAEERKACAVIAESPDTPHRRAYEAYDVPEVLREGIATAIRARRSDCGQATPQE